VPPNYSQTHQLIKASKLILPTHPTTKVSNALAYYGVRPRKSFSPPFRRKKEETKKSGSAKFSVSVGSKLFALPVKPFQAKKFLQNGQKAAHRQAGHGQNCELDFYIRGLCCKAIYSRNYYCKLMRLSMLAIDT
jgi:hypothetical protein